MKKIDYESLAQLDASKVHALEDQLVVNLRREEEMKRRKEEELLKKKRKRKSAARKRA
jgi:hypothetical protein